jgi:hypothetical protein
VEKDRRELMPNKNELLEPTIDLKADFIALAKEFADEGDDRYRDAISNFEMFVQLCADEAVGRNLTAGKVQQSTFGWSAPTKGFLLVLDYGMRSCIS